MLGLLEAIVELIGCWYLIHSIRVLHENLIGSELKKAKLELMKKIDKDIRDNTNHLIKTIKRMLDEAKL